MKKKLLIILPTIALLLAAIYLFAIPSLQSNSYKVTANSSHSALASSVNSAINAATQSTFFADDITLAEAKNALKTSKDALSDLETKIQTNENNLTSFTELPMISVVNHNYKTTLDLRLLEEKYVQASKDYANEFKGVTTYEEQTLPLMEMTEQLPALSNKFETAQSPAEFATAIDEVIVKIDEMIKLASSIKPTDSLKEYHEYQLKSLNEFKSILNQTKAAVVAMDLDKLTTLSKTFETQNADIQKKSKDLSVKVVEESKLTKLGNTLKDLNKQIDIKTAEL